ncbi:PREDICTED: globin-like isoform X1 [Habropoda laboriosa]|uniref:globin-like isoform X1 n=1 Tax=Habropoda laboriosa TaxID=597456 RepID=UPI00083CCCCD|nr:PREDICTED: globin-like isoform X1 [Habropoda laboriosa]XP_017791068.1 PREDICTED: globin-like isoform X1 [Habropoda laboriosa]
MGTFLRFLGITNDDNRIDQATGLTERQKKLVQNTWAVIRKDEVGSGIAVMTALFKKYPEYQRYFTAFMDTPLNELPANKRFQAHCASVITALNNVIDSLHDPGLMEASLIGLAERHKKRGQTKEEFQVRVTKVTVENRSNSACWFLPRCHSKAKGTLLVLNISLPPKNRISISLCDKRNKIKNGSWKRYRKNEFDR